MFISHCWISFIPFSPSAIFHNTRYRLLLKYKLIKNIEQCIMFKTLNHVHKKICPSIPFQNGFVCYRWDSRRTQVISQFRDAYNFEGKSYFPQSLNYINNSSLDSLWKGKKIFFLNLKFLLWQEVLVGCIVFLLAAKIPGSKHNRTKRIWRLAPLLIRPVTDINADSAHTHTLATLHVNVPVPHPPGPVFSLTGPFVRASLPPEQL